jgi:hypothetical protein
LTPWRQAIADPAFPGGAVLIDPFAVSREADERFLGRSRRRSAADRPGRDDD